MTANYESDNPSDRLAAVRLAIKNCLSAQSYAVGKGNREHTMAELKQLRELEKDLMQEVADSGNGGSMCSLAQLSPENP